MTDIDPNSNRHLRVPKKFWTRTIVAIVVALIALYLVVSAIGLKNSDVDVQSRSGSESSPNPATLSSNGAQ